jgi:hypothetical protein
VLVSVFGSARYDAAARLVWELVVLVAGCGLIALRRVDRVPGAAWLGVAHLAAFLAARTPARTTRCCGGRSCSCCSAAA